MALGAREPKSHICRDIEVREQRSLLCYDANTSPLGRQLHTLTGDDRLANANGPRVSGLETRHQSQ